MIVFAVIVIIQALASIASLSWTMHEFLRLQANSDIGPTQELAGGVYGQAGIGIFEVVYQVVLVLDAGRRKNIVQLVGVCLNNVSMLVLVPIALSGVNASIEALVTAEVLRRDWHHIYAYKTTIGFLVSTSFLMMVVTWLGFREFEW